MGFLFGGGHSGLPAKDQLPMGQNIARSATHQEARVLPLLYGRNRLGCTFISDVFDLRVEQVSTGGKTATKVGTNYYASFAVAVGHGPMTAFHDLYLNGDPVFSDNTKLYSVSLKMVANIATYQTKNPHGLTTGDTVNVFNADQPEFNGQFIVTVISTTQFQYAIPGSSLPNETATFSNGKRIYCLVKLPPIYATGADFTDITIPDFGVARVYWGTETQTQDAYLSGTSGIQHPPYKGICYIVFHQLFLGFNQTSVQNVEVVMERTPLAGLADSGQVVMDGDCNPACIMADLLGNQRLGLACDLAADINLDSLNAAQNQFYGENIGFSLLITRPEEVRSQLVNFLTLLDALPVLDAAGKIAIKLQRYADIGSKTLLTDADLVDLPSFDPSDWSSVVNETYINFTDRDAGWNPDFVVWKDTAASSAKNRPDPLSLDKSFITQRDIAQRLVAVAGQIAALPAVTGELKVAFDADIFATLTPGAVVKFVHDLRPALNSYYRVQARSLPDPSQPVMVFDLAIDRTYIYPAAIPARTPSIVTSPASPDLEPVGDFEAYKLVQLPAGLSPSADVAIAFLIQRDVPSTLFAEIYLGRNYVFNGAAPDSFLKLGTINKFAWKGVLTVAYPAATAYLTPANTPPAEAPGTLALTDSFTIQLAGPDLILPDVCDFDALADSTLLFIGDEIMSIAEAVMTDSGAYSLTVIRGRFGTTIADHANGDDIFVINRADLVALLHPHFVATNTASFKLVLDWQTPADVTAFEYVVV